MILCIFYLLGWLPPLLLQVLFCPQGGRTAGACSRNRLPIAPVLHIPAGENSLHPGVHIVMGHHIAVAVELNLVDEWLHIGLMPDAEKHARNRQREDRPRLQMLQAETG